MAYDDSSFYGDLICNDYDEQNNFINPPSPMGFLVYILLGYGLDLMTDYCNQFMNDTSILTADTRGLDNFWGISYNMPRPSINGRLLTDEEYKIYLYLRNCRLMTREDIETCFNKCFGIDDYTVYFSYETNYMGLVDHNNYESLDTVSSNLKKNSEDSSNEYIIDFANSSTDVQTLQGYLSELEASVIVINIPYNNYDAAFLELLEQYISVKGNVKIKEFNL